ncbi:hypothetical protein NQ317_012527 [Molorchus minor]|uniref:Epg5-like TPR domain-containing protein n=1 Tax=Molorchus minor TaxID=1323400 RepID=A0ABQ9K313_9CUCU|nr:hypothetical protein NQ317_012527 [Molorchus minor]
MEAVMEKSSRSKSDELTNLKYLDEKYNPNTAVQLGDSPTEDEHISKSNEDASKKLCDDFTEILNMNKEIITTLKIKEVSCATVFKLPVTVTENELGEAAKKTEIKPYTESQLSSLYHNDELETLEQFNLQFVWRSSNTLFYELLSNYLKVREKITGNNLELEQIRKEYKLLQNDLWTIEIASVSGRGECQDGTAVYASHNYNKSIFHRSVFQSIVRILGNVQKLTYENYVLYSYSAEELRVQIEIFLQSVINNCINVTQLDKHAPVALTIQCEPMHIKPYLAEVRLCISILFSFQRKLIRETQFISETRQWLTQLVAVLLRLSNFQDHLFILNHVLRCASGVGSWAACFIQAPLDINLKVSPFGSYQVNHVLVILATILMPIGAREQFLEDIAQNKEMATDALWVMVDSDGEEDEESTGTSLRENDLVALLNQLPLDNLFRDLLLIYRRDFQDIYDVSCITEHHILRFLAFSTVLLKIIYRGIQTYNQPRYNQFSKRLSRFIRHIAQYATDQWEEFLRVQNLEDKAMLERLQVEYDAFFLRTIYYLYSSQKLGAWQFLAVVPYHMVRIKTLWKIFYFLHSSDRQAKDILDPLDNEDYCKKLWDAELRSQFEEKLINLEDAEVYYLLNTFANMALARGNEDMDFIHAAAEDLLKVGFISESTQESCSKSARILLTHLTSKHPHLLSDILRIVKDNIEKIGPLVLYLYEELPLQIWKLTDTDLDIISRLLLNNSITSNDNKLARMILSRLNWDSLSYDTHCDVAILVVRAADQEHGILSWAWQTILRLKLHISDKAFKEIGRVQEVERYDILLKGIREQKPLASFVAVLMTTWGHLVPLICSKGLYQLSFLQSQQKHEAVLFALYQIIPLFITSQECLINCDKFQEVLMNLLNADRGYISMAKSLVYAQDTVLQQFGNMIETQIVNFAYYDLNSPRCLVRLWINSLVSIPYWTKDKGIIYLLDVIVRTAFFHPDALEVAYNILRDLLQEGTPQEHSGTITSIFRWVSSTNTNGSLISNSLSNYTWLAYILIAVEHQEKEVHSGLWNELLKAASVAKVPVISSSSLCIYRWAQQALDTAVDHPLLPLLWQNFYTLYLSRILPPNSIEKSCVGDRFFDGLVNFAFLKKIKRRLQEAVDYYQVKMDHKDEDGDQGGIRRNSIGRAFSLWLEEPRLQENNVLLKNLPPQYQPALLTFIMQGSASPWYEFLDSENLKRQQQMCIRTWRVANFREKTNVNRPLLNPGSGIESSDPRGERILRRLTSYDNPKPPPDITISAPVVPKVDFGSKEEMFKSLEQCFKMLKQFAHSHAMKLSEHKALDCSYQELIPQLYRSVLNKVKRKVPCKGRQQAVHCSGAAIIILEMQEARINERIDHQVQTNRNAYESLLVKALQPPSINLVTAAVTLHQTIKLLQAQVRCNPATAELGVELFYYILSLLNEEINNYPPTKTLFSICLETLGQSHICGFEYEMPRLLQKILKDPNLAVYLSPHFSTE